MVATNAAFAQLYELLTSMPGVGAVLAFTLIALLPELGKMSRKQIAALVGLAPYDFDSGKLRGHRSIYGGRMPICNVLYMGRTSTSSAMLSTDGGTTTPSILAVCWLMTSSNFCGTGGLPVGLSPLILGAAGGSRLRVRHRCRSLSGRLDLRFGKLAAKVCR